MRVAHLCPFVQGEPYYLRTTFRRQLKDFGFHTDRILSPVLNLTSGLSAIRPQLIEMASKMGISRGRAAEAADYAVDTH